MKYHVIHFKSSTRLFFGDLLKLSWIYTDNLIRITPEQLKIIDLDPDAATEYFVELAKKYFDGSTPLEGNSYTVGTPNKGIFPYLTQNLENG